MKKIYNRFLTAVKTQLYSDTSSYKEFITKHTYLKGKPFSFKNHEFQEYIIDLIQDNPGKIFAISKPSQIGLSEILNRLILSIAAVKPGTAILVSFPSITFSQEVFKTRLSPIINSSPELRVLINKDIDSSSCKAFYNESIMYALGGSVQSNTSLLNRPISIVFVDEVDRQDAKIISSYATRMVHTSNPLDRLTLYVSTPTAEGIGINHLISKSGIIHRPYTKCPCGHEFIPDFYEDVVIPGFDEPMTLLTSEKAAALNLDLAYLQCPECKGEINKENRGTVWKIEYNEKASSDNIGVELNPFAAMGFRTMPALVKDYVNMEDDSEFQQQMLGKTADTNATTVNLANIIFTKSAVSGVNIAGLDLGKECHWMHGVQKSDTTVHVVNSQIVKLSELEDFLKEQNKAYTFSAIVADSEPYADLIYKLVRVYPRFFSAIYISPKPPKPELYTIKLVDKLNEMVRQIAINKTLAMDAFAGGLKDFFTFESGPYDAAITKHFTDMRRVRDYRFDENIFKWVKSSKGRDHFWHTAIYLYLASKLAYSGLSSAFAVPIVANVINVERKRAEMRLRR